MAAATLADVSAAGSPSTRGGLAAALRRKLFGIRENQVLLSVRGVVPVSPVAGERLETIGRTFLTGYNAALGETRSRPLAEILDRTDLELRGFAYEGAAMGLALLDTLTPWRRDRHAELLAGPGAPHVYLVHVGAGWAWAALRRNASRAARHLDPVLRWLAVDGYGFFQAFFRRQRSVVDQRLPRGAVGYARHAFDQGLGRGLWFAEGADVSRIAERIDLFAEPRRADLWSGVGLACAYAGGVDKGSLELLVNLAGENRATLAQGVTFAAKARQRAGNPAAHTEAACALICGMSADEAARMTDEELAQAREQPEQPTYEVWRRRIQMRFGATDDGRRG